MSTTLFTLLYVGSGALMAAAVARFGATLAVTWTGGDDKQLEDSRKWSTGFALVGGGLAACSPVNPLLALLLAVASGAFVSFCLGLWFLGMRVPKDYARLLSIVDAKAGQVNTALADPKTKTAIKAEAVKVLQAGQAQLRSLTSNDDRTVAEPAVLPAAAESALTRSTELGSGRAGCGAGERQDIGTASLGTQPRRTKRSQKQ